jgi:hypothetical protein
MSAVDTASQALFLAAAQGDPRGQVHVATYNVTAEQVAARGHLLDPDVDVARIMRSVVMKPESEAQIPAIHERLESLTPD